MGKPVAHLKPKGTRTVALARLGHGVSFNYHSEIRRALRLLADMGDKSVLPRVVPLIKSKSMPIRVSAAVAALRLGHQGAAQPLAIDMQNLAQDHLPSFVRRVGRIREAEAQKHLRSDLSKFAKQQEVPLAVAAEAIGLAWDNDKGIFPLLRSLRSKSVQRRKLAARYLRKAKGRKVTSLLRRALAREKRPMQKALLMKEILRARS